MGVLIGDNYLFYHLLGIDILLSSILKNKIKIIIECTKIIFMIVPKFHHKKYLLIIGYIL